MARLVPYLYVHDARAALDFYARALGAVARVVLTDPESGRIGHAEIDLPGGPAVFLSDAWPDQGMNHPVALGGTPMSLQLETPDCDATTARMQEAGGSLLVEPADMMFGQRHAVVQDPFGHRWVVAQILEAMDGAEIQRRWDAMVQEGRSEQGG